MKRLLLFKSLLLLCALIVGTSAWADNATLTNAEIYEAGAGADGYRSLAINGGGGKIWNAYAIKNQHSNATSSYHYLQIKKYAKGTAYYIQVPEYGTKITSITMTVSSTSKAMDGGDNSATLYFSSSNTTSSTGTGVASGTGASSVTIDCSSLNLNTGYITASAGVRIWDVAVTYTASGGGGSTVSTPTFNHGTGTYTTAQNVELSCDTEGATIHYTMTEDGTTPDDPTESDATYSSAISVTKNGSIIKAKAFKEGSNASLVASATYTIQPDQPTFEVSTVVAGKVNRGAQLTMSATAGHTIIYTIDGTKPSFAEPNGDIYDSPITINTPMTIKAIAVDDNENESQQTIATYAIYYAGGVNITPSYTFFGKDDTFSGTTNDEVTGTTTEGIVLTYTRNGSSLYANGSAMRFYKDNTLKIDAPAGKAITNVVFTQSNGTPDDMTSTPSGYNSTTKTWTGDATSVTFTRTEDSYLQFSNIEVVLAAKVTISEYQWGTYVSDQVMDFTNSDVKAYVVTGASGTAITKTPVTKAAANTPLLLNAPEGTYTIPVAATGTDYSSSNKLVAGTGAAVAYDANSGYNYVLAVDNGKAMFMRIVDGTPATVPSGKAYLALDAAPSGARGLNLFDDEDVTGIDATLVNSEKVNSDVFDLQGRKVANPTKGLYIVNGKKYVIK